MSSYGMAITPLSAAIVTSAVGGADELSGELTAALVLVAQANARATAEEPAEVGRLGERAVRARRGDLERVALTDLRQLVRDALAERERHALGVIDEEADGVATDELGEQHLDIRLARRERCLDLGLDAAHLPSFKNPDSDNKKSGRAPTFCTTAGPWPDSESCSETLAPCTPTR